MNRNIRHGLAAAAVLTAACQAWGGLVSWNVSPDLTNYAPGKYANWVPGGGANPNNPFVASTVVTSGISAVIWDGFGPYGHAGSGFAPDASGFGGQLFDAKAMYARNDATTLYVGIVTGFNPAGVLHDGITYHVGDLAVNPDWSKATAAFGLLLPDGAVGTAGQAGVVAGGTWIVPNLATGVAPPPYIDRPLLPDETPLAYGTFSYEDTGVTYTDAQTGQDVPISIYELSIPLASIGMSAGGKVDLSWGMSCNNDSLQLTHEIIVPEPTGLSGAMLALGGLLVRRRKA